MLVSKYLKRCRTNFYNLDGWKRYKFIGTYNGTDVMYHKSQIYDPINDTYGESFIPVSSWSHVKVIGENKVVSKLIRMMMQFRTSLSNPKLNIGDRISFTAKVREYVKSGYFTGDLLSVVKDAKDITQGFRFRPSHYFKRTDVMAALLWDNDNPFKFSYLSWQSPFVMSHAIFNYYMGASIDAQFIGNKYVSNEVRVIISLLESTPIQYAINCNRKTPFTIINADGSAYDTSKKSPYQLIKPLNDKAHLITSSKMEKLRGSYNSITNFYILLKGLHRALD